MALKKSFLWSLGWRFARTCHGVETAFAEIFSLLGMALRVLAMIIFGLGLLAALVVAGLGGFYAIFSDPRGALTMLAWLAILGWLVQSCGGPSRR